MDYVRIGKLRKDLVVDELEQGKVDEIEPIGAHFVWRLSKMSLKLKHSAQVSRIVWDHQAGIRERPQPFRAEFAWPPSGRVSVKWIGADESHGDGGFWRYIRLLTLVRPDRIYSGQVMLAACDEQIVIVFGFWIQYIAHRHRQAAVTGGAANPNQVTPLPVEKRQPRCSKHCKVESEQSTVRVAHVPFTS
jgi:hypothetical protein